MGEVYRARDTKLGRDVALKVLPDLFAADPDRLDRFQREAQVLASLNHPNIAAIHGFEESASVRALVLELVEGPTLADRIAKGAILLDEALPIARQIAEALEVAHEHGVIHRDLKPANVKIRPDGTVKVLDFGLAKLAGPADSGASSVGGLSMSPTLTSPVGTRVGLILGTAAYMSPEQAKGRPVDKRADVWAFGCVLYEMLTGRRAFEGDDLSEVLASVIKSDVDWHALPASTPPPIRRLLQRCLTRDLKRRIPDISVARYEIDEVLSGAAEAPAAPVPPAAPSGSRMRRVLALAGALVLGALAAAASAWWLLRPSAPPVIRLTATPRGTVAAGDGSPASDIAISPDGLRIVYTVGAGPGNNPMFVRSLDQLEASQLKTPLTAINPFMSPDGQWVGFFDGPNLKKVSVTGGSPVTICPVVGVARGATWSPDGTIVFATDERPTGLFRVSASGGAPEPLTKAEGLEADHIFPHVLPSGRAVLFTIVPTNATSSESGQIAVLDLTTKRHHVLFEGGTAPQFASSGHLVFGVEATLRAIAFDAERLEVRGSAVPVAERVVNKATGAMSFGLAANGTLAYIAGDPRATPERTLVWVDRKGQEEPLGVPVRAYVYPRISPDGTRVALDIRDQDNDVWIWDLQRRTLTRLTFDPQQNRGVAWSPDGKRLAFSIQLEQREDLFWQPADGTGKPERLAESKRPLVPNSFTPDSKNVLVTEGGTAPYDLGLVNLQGEHRYAPLLKETYNERAGEVSPNGRWLAYQSNESGQDEIFVRPYPEIDSGRWQVSQGGGTRPAWSRDGRELFYFQAPGKVLSVAIQPSQSFQAGTPEVVVNGQYSAPNDGRTYDVSLDGKRFLMIKPARTQATSVTELVVTLNWSEELKKVVPGK
jgi:serine/threonine-protein kinase